MANWFEVGHLMDKLKISQDEALELIKYDKQSEALQKAKLEELKVDTPELSKATVTSKSTAPKTKAKPSPASNSKSKNVKESLIENMNSFAADLNVTGIQNLKANSVTFIGEDGNYYTLALTAHKGAPTGYKG